MLEEELKELSSSAWDRAIDAIKKMNAEEAVELINLIRSNCEKMHNQLTEWIWSLLTFIANVYGEEDVGKALRFRHECFPIKVEHLSAEELARNEAIYMGCAHFSNISVKEEDDKFIIRKDPCGSGGRMLKQRLNDPPYNLGVTSKGYDWSWEKKGVSYYCAHCCVREEAKINAGGPKIVEIKCPLSPEDPCYTYIYKKKNI